MTLLPVNDDVTIPGVVMCIDVQTIATPDQVNPKKFHHTLRCWSAVSGRIEDYKWTREKSRASQSASEFWNWLNFSRLTHRPTWLFASELPITLTVLGVWKLMESGEFSLHRRPSEQEIQNRRKRKDRKPERVESGLLITSGPPDVVVMYHRTGWKVILLDVANYLPDSNADAANSPDHTSTSAPSKDAPLANWLHYSAARCQSLRDQISDLICWHRKQEMGRFGYSIAGIALAGFRHRFMHLQPDCPDDVEIRDLQRQAYYPGRVEAFFCGKVDASGFTPVAYGERQAELFGTWPAGPFPHVDARSFYGAIGSCCDLPVSLLESSPDSGDCPPPVSGRIGEYLAGVELSTGDSVYPVRHAGRVLYARGHYRTVLCGPELNRAYQRGHIVRWLWWQRFALGKIFKDFCDAVWDERVNAEKGGNLTIATVCKQLLARLHGKFLQRKNKWEPRPAMRAPEPWAEWGVGSATSGVYRKFRSVGWDVEEETDGGDAPQCFPALAAWVTAWGREWLNTWMEYAGRQNVLYVATDCLIVTMEGKERLEKRGIIWPDGIGSCRVVAVSESIDIKGPNNYRFGERRVRSGRSERHNGIVAGEGVTVAADTLRSVLYDRHGDGFSTTILPFTDQPCHPFQRLTADGWLLPPELNTCSKHSPSPLSTCATS